MAENQKQAPSLGDRAREIVRQILEAIEELTRPAPALVPVPARPRRR